MKKILMKEIKSDISNHHTKHFRYEKITKCFDKSILFIFRHFECHHTHYQGTAFRLKFQFLLILQYS